MSRLQASSCRLSPGTPFFSFFPFFSSLFFSFLAVENGKLLLRCGIGERRSRDSSGNKKTTQPKTTFSFFPFFSSLFFFLFWPSKMKKSRVAASSGRGGARAASSSIVGEEEDQPTQNDVVLGWFDFFKIRTPKTTSFWGVLFFYFKKRQAQNDVVLGFQQPKRRHFRVSQP